MRKIYLTSLWLLAMLSICGVATAQGLNVTGRVTDVDGSALIGASVTIEGTTRGVTTDLDGRYSISVSSGSEQIVFSYVGYASQTIAVGSRTTINVTLQPDQLTVDEVIVTGYQTISKERAAGSFSKINAQQWEDKRVVNVDDILEGRIAGYSNGLIRGTTSFFAGSQPLYVVDGFPIESARYSSTGTLEEALPDLNMEDVESVTVLKDAAATSIYGARAANGVVVIVTKKAKPNQTNISFASTFTLTPYHYYTGNLADAASVIDIERELIANNPAFANPATAQDYLDRATYSSWGIKALLNYYAGNSTQAEMDNILNGLAQGGFSYFDDVEKYGKRNSFSQQYNLNIGHGTEKSSTNVSFSYIRDALHDKFSNRDNFGGNITTSYKLAKWLTVDFGTYFNFKRGKEQTYNLMSPSYSYSVYDRLVNPDGTHYTTLASDRRSNTDNETIRNNGLYGMDATYLDEIGMNRANTRDFSNRSYARLNIKFTDFLRYSASFQYEYGNYDYKRINDRDSYAVRSLVNAYSQNVNGATVFNIPYGDIYYHNTGVSNSYNFRQQIDFDKTFAGVHNVTALAGFEARHMKINYEGETKYNYDDDVLSYSPIDEERFVGRYFSGLLGGGTLSRAPINELVNRYISLYANAAYTYDNRYIFNGSVRWDRSNLWGTSSKYQDKPIWSVGAAWNAHNESFFAVDWVNMLKVRLSYGIGGNIAKDSSPYLTANYSNNNNVGGIQGTVTSQPNPLLSWEKTTTFNLGVDFAIFGNRLNGSIDYYRKNGENLLSNTMGNPTEGFGFSTMRINNGEMTNNGIELVVSGEILRKGDFSLNASVVFAYNKNEVTDNTAKAPVSYLQLDYPNAYPRIGDPYNSIYGYRWAGLSSEGIPQIYNSEGEITSFQPSDMESIVHVGSQIPTYNGSLNMDLRYKNFSLSFMLLYEGGHQMRNTFLPTLSTAYAGAAGGYIPMTNGAINRDIAKRWRQAGDERHTDIPRLMTSIEDYRLFDESIYRNASINVVEAAHLRLRNVTVGYRLPSRIARKAVLQNARVTFSMENLFMLARSSEAKYMLGGYIKPSYVLGLNLSF